MAPTTPDAASSPSLTADTPAAINANRNQPGTDAPRRCFICLCDEEPSDPPGSWVDACPCTLTAHQDCAQSWVTDRERSRKPLQCPVCKYKVELEGPWDPVVALTDAVSRRFTRVSPVMLFTGVSVGVNLSLHAYGTLALYAFAGRDAALEYLGMRMGVSAAKPSLGAFMRQRVGTSLVMVAVAPTLLFGQLLPGFSNKVFTPMASLYGMWHALHDPFFLTWPPSPQLAIAMFPYVRSAYYNFWKETVFPREVKLNRQIMGLPPLEDRPEERDGNNGNNGNNNNNDRQRNEGGEGGLVGFLQNLLWALDPDEEDGDHRPNAMRIVNEEVHAEQGGVDEEVVFELVIGDDAEEAAEQDEFGDDDHEDFQDAPPPPPPEFPAPQPGGEAIAEPPLPHFEADDVAVPPLLPAQPAQAAHEQHNHEAPPAPPARRAGLGALLSSASNNIVSSLAMPMISFTMGELLKLALPRAWVVCVGVSRSRPPGLLQQQWGRSLVGGCLFVVLRDAVRFYTKSRKVAAMTQRKVKNVKRRR